MEPSLNTPQEPRPRILLCSQRSLTSHVIRCLLYEFEDLICALDTADLIAPREMARNPLPQRLHGAAQALLAGSRFNAYVNRPRLSTHPVEGTYDLFLILCSSLSDLAALEALPGWRDQCQQAICWVNEIWDSQAQSYHPYLKTLELFDHLILSSETSVKQFAETSFHTVLMGVDAIQFAPVSKTPLMSTVPDAGPRSYTRSY